MTTLDSWAQCPGLAWLTQLGEGLGEVAHILGESRTQTAGHSKIVPCGLVWPDAMWQKWWEAAPASTDHDSLTKCLLVH